MALEITDSKQRRPTSSAAGRGLAAARRVLLAAGFVAGAAFTREATAQNDSVQQKDGKVLTGKIGAETYDNLEIVVRAGQPPQKVSWENVNAASIKYAAPPEFTEASDKLGKGNLEDALAAFTALKGDAKLSATARPPLRQQVLLQVASLSQRLGKLDDAIADWSLLLKEFPNGRYLDRAAAGLVDAHLAKGAADAAGKALDGVVADAAANHVGARFNTTVALLRASILEQQKKYAEARAAYEAAAKTPGLPADQLATTNLGIARCLYAEGKVTEADSRYRLIVAGDAPKLVLAGAWNGIGEIAKDQGAKKRDTDLLTEALFDFMRGVVLYLPLEGESTREYERAVDGASQCFEYIAQVDTNPQIKTLYKQRAQELRNRIRK